MRFFAAPAPGPTDESFEDPTTQTSRESFDDPTSPVTPSPGFEDAITRINDTPRPPETLPKGSNPRLPAVRQPTPLFEPRIEDAAAAIAAVVEQARGEDVTNVVPLPRARSPRATPARADTESSVITSAPDRR